MNLTMLYCKKTVSLNLKLIDRIIVAFLSELRRCVFKYFMKYFFSLNLTSFFYSYQYQWISNNDFDCRFPRFVKKLVSLLWLKKNQINLFLVRINHHDIWKFITELLQVGYKGYNENNSPYNYPQS